MADSTATTIALDLNNTPSVRDEFLIDWSTCSQINHGSYGVVPKCILSAQARAREAVEALPDSFYRRQFPHTLYRELAAVRPFYGDECRLDDLVFVPNATSAVNAIVNNSIDFVSGDAILVNDITYPSFEITVKRRAQLVPGVEVVKYSVTDAPPMQDPQAWIDFFIQSLIRARKEIEDRGLRLKLAIVDHIASCPALVFPVKEIVVYLRSWLGPDLFILVDAAHAIGQIPHIDVPSLQCDAYVSNLHKWFFSPKTVALLWVAESRHDMIRTPILAQDPPFYPECGPVKIVGQRDPPRTCIRHWPSKLQETFYWQGTSDLTAYCCISDTVHFVNERLGGLPAIHAYNTTLADRVTQHIVRFLPGTIPLPIPKEFTAPFLRNFILPPAAFGNLSPDLRDKIAQNNDYFQHEFFLATSIQLLLGARPATKDSAQRLVLWRISFQVYNCMDDYIKAADAVKAFFKL